MKRILILTLFLGMALKSFGQTDGITYQAVIIGPDDLELPGVDSEGNYLPNATIAVRFTIFDSTNQIEFQEVQVTDTDEFGRINLLIGDADHDYFKEISWDGTPKDLRVEIDFDAGSNFEVMSRERLTFLPYAYHRNITATGTLTVDDRTFLNGELQVEGPTNLNSSLDVNNGNATNLTGTLTVDGETNLNEAFTVNNGSPSELTGDLGVNGNTALDGTLDVIGLTTLNDLTVNGEASFGDLTADNLVVNQSTTLNGVTRIDGMGNQIRLTSNLPNTGTEMSNHPVLIDGGNNGLAIKVNGSRNNSTNFITFYDDENDSSNISWGRIEGEKENEFENNADHNFNVRGLDWAIYDAGLSGLFAGADVYAAVTGTAMAFSSSTGCAGIGACVTAPIPSMIFKYTTESVVVTIQAITTGVAIFNAIDNKNLFLDNRVSLQGVTYASGAGDYAEYLLRENINEEMIFGDIVGVKGGKISKNTENAERAMVVSRKPIVLGNMPQKNREKEYEKVAFMGQVPVKVYGKVNKGDYIIPSGRNDGIGLAVSPEKITLKDINNIVGVAWEENNEASAFNLINVVVGTNTNDNNHIVERLEAKITTQQLEIDALKNKMNEILDALAKGETQRLTQLDQSQTTVSGTAHNQRKYEIVELEETDVIYFEITKTDIEKAIVAAEESMKESGLYDANKEVWEKLQTDGGFRQDFITELHGKLQKQLHYHKEIDQSSKH
ncbi:hypothetical protein J4050_08300 [Winogradskyella sp. DF17]|uniref:Peptidase S74 domain-containing protein n=1 Tax=Winogradskyella pelagia TaxID=2819984 RepID=A0ABS3T1W8_9FLAO|nr:hypothetical protein [Winogradskyella sp. DF17]MBO3116744.1 hypothetical protein [Winogradskyella sp. DF17]